MIRLLKVAGGRGNVLGVAVGDVELLLEGEPGAVAVDLLDWERVVDVLWSVFLVSRVDEGVELQGYSEDEEVGEVEDAELVHERLGVCSGWVVCDESDYLFLGAY